MRLFDSRCRAGDFDTVSRVKVGDIGVLSDYLSFRRGTLPHSIARNRYRLLRVHQRPRTYHHTIRDVSCKSESLIPATVSAVLQFCHFCLPRKEYVVGNESLRVNCQHDFQGKENLVLPLVILGAISVIGGLSGLRLPETLHHRLPQTVEEGELFGKDWTCADCIRCIPIKYAPARNHYAGDRATPWKTIPPSNAFSS